MPTYTDTSTAPLTRTSARPSTPASGNETSNRKGRFRSCFSYTTIANKIKKFDVQNGQPIKEIKPRQTILPICMVSSLFFSWGLLYGLLDVMNYHVKVAMGVKRQEAALLAAGYYLAYLPGTLFIGAPFVKYRGYRYAMIMGLVIMTIGTYFMSLGAAAKKLWAMTLSHAVIGLAVSTLERAANPYAVNCGPRRQATLRILFAQAWAGIGTVVAPFLANEFVFSDSASKVKPTPNPSQAGTCLLAQEVSTGDLSSVVSFYRALSGCVFLLACCLCLAFFRTTWVPEVAQPESPRTTCGWKLWRHPLVSVRYARIWWGVFSNFFNLGCQVTVAQFFIEHMKVNACQSEKWAATDMSFAQIAFVGGRFAAALLVTMPKIFKPRVVLACFIAGAIAFVGASTSVTGGLAIGTAIAVMFWEAPSFPMIFESATAGFGEWTPTAETLMILSISGGALQPVLMGTLVESEGVSKGWWLTTACFCLVFSYCIAINVVPSFRRGLDAAESEVRRGAILEGPSEEQVRAQAEEKRVDSVGTSSLGTRPSV